MDKSNSSNNICDMQMQQIKSVRNKFSTPTGKGSKSRRYGRHKIISANAQLNFI